MIADAARCWLDVPEVKFRYRVMSRQREIDFGKRLMTPDEARLLLGEKPPPAEG